MPTRDSLAGKTKQGATSIVKFGLQISIIKTMFTNNTPSYSKYTSHVEIFYKQKKKFFNVYKLLNYENNVSISSKHYCLRT
jgi:hypothetical protein